MKGRPVGRPSCREIERFETRGERGMMDNIFLKCTKHITTDLFVIGLALLLSIPVLAAEGGRRVLRVAFPQVASLSWTADDGSRHGMVVDYLNEISKYTGWEYEYIDVYGAGMLDRFQAGEFDLMGGNYYIPILEKYYGYPDYNMGCSRVLLLARQDDSSIHSYDIKSLNGKTIGVYERSKENIRRLKEFLTINGLECPLRYLKYEEITKMGNFYPYLENGEIDLLLGNLADNNHYFRVVLSFDSQPYYIVTQPGDKETLDGLNMALERILDANPNFAIERYAANFPDCLVDVQLNERDKQYIGQKKTVVVAVPKDWPPFFNRQTSNDSPPGLIADMVRKVHQFTGLDFSYRYAASYSEAMGLVQRGEADILGFFLGDEGEATRHGLALSATYARMNNILIRYKGSSYPDTGLIGAVMEGQELPGNIMATEIRTFPTIREALSAVNRGEADFIYGLASRLEQDIQRYRFSNLVPVTLVNDMSDISFAVARPVDPDLLTVFNKSINSLSEEEKTSLLNRNMVSVGINDFSLIELIYAHPLEFVLIVAFILLFLVMGILLIARARIRAAVIQSNLEKAEAANRAKSEFLSRMSHEIRTPMNGIIGMSVIAMQHLNDPQKLADCLKKVTMSSNHLLALLNDVLDMSKIESGKVELKYASFDFRMFLEELRNLYEGQAESKGIAYETVLQGEVDEWVMGDALRVNQILSNLLSNALKFTSSGGAVTLSVSQRVEGNKVWICFEVMDTGCGIAEQNYEKIFESFEQENADVTHKYGGTGLGLSIVKRFTELMGGHVSVRSGLGTGSTFTVELPFGRVRNSTSMHQFSDLTQRREQGESYSPSDYDFKGKRILLAEDNELNREIAIELIEATGASIEAAEDGKQAVEMFEQSVEGYYDLILMDVQMPHMDGYEATRRIRSLDRRDARTIWIFAMTANAFAEDEEKSREAGMNGHISKPLDVKVVYERLNSLFHP